MTVKAVAVDLDGTIVHTVPEAHVIKGRSRDCYLSAKTAALLAEISQRLPTFITTGRNAPSVAKITEQLAKVRFAGFVLENGFVVKTDLSRPYPQPKQWRFAAKVPPSWEAIPGYECSTGFILPDGEKKPRQLVEQLMQESGEEGCIIFQPPKIFVYPQEPDKMLGLSRFNAAPYIALGNDFNDIQLFQHSKHPVTLTAACPELKAIVQEKNGYCSPLAAHAAAEDMLAWALAKLTAA
ncbi:Hydroxymethylpyrimidine pyrophosphatase [Candidatus Electronema halotolerans]